MHPSVIVQNTPDKPAVFMAGTGETITFQQLEDRSNQGAQLFRKLGLKTGDGIAIFMENNIRFHEICWAAQRAGLYFTAISSRLTAGEVEYIVKDANAKVLIVSHGLAKVAAEAIPLVPGGKLLSVGGAMPGYASYEDESGKMPAERIADETSGAAMLYSSGTTGRPKGVRQPLSGQPIDAPTTIAGFLTMLYAITPESSGRAPAPRGRAAPRRGAGGGRRRGGAGVV